ncbi:unnamed protein product [Ectocarpus fasciculatus]
METGRTDTTSPSDRGLGCGDIQRGNRSQGQGEDTQRRATPRMGSETLLLAGGLNLSNNMGRGRETAGRTSARGGSRASEGRSSDQPRLGLARPGKTGSGSAAGSSFVRVSRVSLEPQDTIRQPGGGVHVTAANARSPSKADAIRKMGSTVAVRRRTEFGKRTGLTWSVLPVGGVGGKRTGSSLCPTPDAVYEAIWGKYGSAWEYFVLQK